MSELLTGNPTLMTTTFWLIQVYAVCDQMCLTFIIVQYLIIKHPEVVQRVQVLLQ